MSVAREDRDATVRLAALRKVLSPTLIAEVGRQDADPRVREEAATLLLDLANGAFEGTDEAESMSALEGLTEPRLIVTVARSAASEKVARTAMGRVSDHASLGSIARRSSHPAVRMEALARLNEPDELLAVAVRTEFKDVALAAVERLGDRAMLEDVAAKAKNKSAAKRARALLKALENAAAAVAAQPRPEEKPGPTEEEMRRDAAAAACERLEALPGTAIDEGEAALGEIERSWRLACGTDFPELAARFEAARDVALEALRRHQEERTERARLIQAAAEAAASRHALCERIDGIAGEETARLLEEARAEWEKQEPLQDAAEAERWRRRFDAACRASEARYKALLDGRTRREKAAGLCQAMARLAETAAFPQARGEWLALRRSWNELTAEGLDDPSLLASFSEADTRLRTLEVESKERRARQQQENLSRLDKLCAGLEATAAAETLTMRAAERALHDARAALDQAVPLPSKADHEKINARLKAVLSTLFPRVQELRDMDEWQRWANAGLQEELCNRVEALMQVEDLALAAKQLREAQAQWKQVAIAPREQSQVLWARFKAASDAVRARCDVYFASLAEQQAANAARKEALCQRAEELSHSTDWIRTAEAIKALQADWKQVGPAPRAAEKALWERFHAACDAFFTRRREDLQHRKEEWSANLARKEALCGQVEAVAETTDWAKGIEEIKRLQAEWKTIGPVRKAKADAVWARFRAACDLFFERYQQRDQAAAAPAIEEAEKVLCDLGSLLPAEGAPGGETPEGLGDRIAELRRKWAAVLPGLPRERNLRMSDKWAKTMAKLVEAWPAAFAGTDLDPEANVRAMEDLCIRIEGLLAAEVVRVPEEVAAGDASTPATLLARQLREALATNTIAGRQDETLRWKTAVEQVRQAQAEWKRIGPVPEAVGRALSARFQRAVQRVQEQREQQRRVRV